MGKRGDPEVLRRVVRFVRFHTGTSQTRFGENVGMDQAAVSEIEQGHRAPTEREQRRMARGWGIPWPVWTGLRHFVEAFLAATARREAGGGDRGTAPAEQAVLERVLLAALPHIVRTSDAGRPTPDQVIAEAERAWEGLARLPYSKRRRLLGLAARTAWGWGLAVAACERSLRAAVDRAGEARELAELASFVAERVQGPKAWRARLQGYCLAHFANAQRVANDFTGAAATFIRAWEAWRQGDDSGPVELGELRLLSLEASLRREQHRFEEALWLLDRALAAAAGDRVATARLLLKKEHVFEQAGDLEGALAVLAAAAPLLDSLGDPQLLFGHRFNAAADLAQLNRYTEAAELLSEVRFLAERQGSELQMLRVLWLEGRVAAGLGRPEEAAEKLEQVQSAFIDLGQPYDAALAALELSMLWLEAGRAAEVAELAAGLGWIFKAQGIVRETLATLVILVEATRRQAAPMEPAH